MKTDDEKPVLIDVPESLSVHTDPGMSTAVVSWQQPSATDNSVEPVTITSNLNSGYMFSIGNTTVTFIATDTSGNEDSAMFTITVTGKTSKLTARFSKFSKLKA